VIGYLTRQVTFNPDAANLPGETVLQQLTNGIGQWALIAALIGLVIGAAMWALGHYSQNYQQAYSGRRGVLVSGVAAVLIGGSANIINFFVAMGRGIH
jgi:hypothetical protein